MIGGGGGLAVSIGGFGKKEENPGVTRASVERLRCSEGGECEQMHVSHNKDVLRAGKGLFFFLFEFFPQTTDYKR